MIRDNTSHRVLRIGELTRLVAGQLILISPKSTASLACTCRCLEEPVLSTLWGTQRSLPTLLKILPEETWGYDKKPLSGNEVCCLGPPFEKSNTYVRGFSSSRLSGNHRQRLGRGSGAMRLGCDRSKSMSGNS